MEQQILQAKMRASFNTLAIVFSVLIPITGYVGVRAVNAMDDIEKSIANFNVKIALISYQTEQLRTEMVELRGDVKTLQSKAVSASYIPRVEYEIEELQSAGVGAEGNLGSSSRQVFGVYGCQNPDRLGQLARQHASVRF